MGSPPGQARRDAQLGSVRDSRRTETPNKRDNDTGGSACIQSRRECMCKEREGPGLSRVLGRQQDGAVRQPRVSEGLSSCLSARGVGAATAASERTGETGGGG